MLARLLALLFVVGCAAHESLAFGACCTGCGTCTITADAAACADIGGSYLGNDTICAPNPCIPRACCDNGCPGGGCRTVFGTACPGGTTDQGLGSCCTPNPCPQPPSPFNDLCTNAIAVTVGTPITGSNDGATPSVPPLTHIISPSCNQPTFDTGTHLDVWYRFVAPTTAPYSVDTCGSSMPDTILSIHSDCPTASQSYLLDCNDDDPCSISGLNSRIASVQLTANHTYYIGVAGYNGHCGAFTLVVNIHTGVCCTGCGGTCSITTAAACAQLGGVYLGDGTTCTPTTCTPRACCDPATCRCAIVFNSPCPTGSTSPGLNTCCTPSPCPTSGTLIFGPSVVGSPSLEESAAVAAGYGPVTVVDAATWGTLAATDFCCYRLIVIGDPHCGLIDSMIAATACTWGPCKTGNGIIIGTDPVYHQTLGGSTLITSAIAFAGNKPNKTGVYICLSCAYGSASPDTPVPELAGFCAACPGPCFTVQSADCYNDVHIVATSPALNGLTSSALSNWSCSIHEEFNSWPTGWIPLAVGAVPGPAAPGGPFQFPCYDDQPAPSCPAPSFGFPYIMACGEITPIGTACACCEPVGDTCFIDTPADCAARGDTYIANGVCTPLFCHLGGACCFGTGCGIIRPSICGFAGGVYSGLTCSPNPCVGATGACCGPCTCTITTGLACTGEYRGDGTVCVPDPCSPPFGACCTASACSVVTQNACTGTYSGDGTICSQIPCGPPNGACCIASTCSFVTQNACGASGGVYFGDGTACSQNVCSPPIGACCCGSNCTPTTPAACVGASRAFAGLGSACVPFSFTTPCCRGDYNKSGTRTVQDIFDFLRGYFSGDPCADSNDSGGPGSVQDIFDLLAAYFAGCP